MLSIALLITKIKKALIIFICNFMGNYEKQLNNSSQAVLI
jgi:hypothetical protein